MDAAGAVELSPGQSLARVRSSTWGRVAISIRTIAMVVPVPIRTVDHRLVFATAWGSAFDRAVQEQAISIQAEGLESTPGADDLLWSVVVSGICRPFTDPAPAAPPLELAGDGFRYHALPFSIVQGWRAPLPPLTPPPRTEPPALFEGAGRDR